MASRVVRFVVYWVVNGTEHSQGFNKRAQALACQELHLGLGRTAWWRSVDESNPQHVKLWGRVKTASNVKLRRKRGA